MTPASTLRTDLRPRGHPLPVAHEVARPGVVELLTARWTHPVTLVVAGAGCGKTTAVAQTVRAESHAPHGVEGWVRVVPGLEDADHLATAMLAALGRSRGDADPLVEVLMALRALAPLEVCLTVDDLHRIPTGSSAHAMLAALVRRLPPNAHLVLVGRSVDLPLTHLLAAGLLAEVGEQDLALTPDEVEDLARRLGRSGDGAAGLGGWPALVRLTLAARRRAAVEFAREEVVAALGPADRDALRALVMVGCADGGELAEICGRPVGLERLVARVPFLVGEGGRRVRAHDLWLDVLDDGDDLDRLQTRAFDVLLARGEVTRAGAVALRRPSAGALPRAAMELVRTCVMALPVGTARSWLAQGSAADVASAEMQLLRAVTTFTLDHDDPCVDALIDDSAEAFARRGDADAQAVALAWAVHAAQARPDLARLRRLGRARPTDPPVVAVVRRTALAVLAERAGDGRAAAELVAGADRRDLPAAVGRLVARLRLRAELLQGRAHEAARIAEEALASTGEPHLRRAASYARWLAGDPTDFASLRSLDECEHTAGSSCPRDAFIGATMHTAIAASWGQHSAVGLRHVRGLGRTCDPDPREAAFATNMRAALAITGGDEPGAADAFEEFLRVHPAPRRAGEAHLRRFLALGYVLNAQLRGLWESVPLGPAHALARDVARRLVAGRDGDRRALTSGTVDPGQVFTVLPLPWSVELACRLHAAGSGEGARLLSWLAGTVGEAVRDRLRGLSTDPELSRPARHLLALVPIALRERLQVGAIGPLTVAVDGVACPGAALRRTRVRELLALLVLRGAVSRELAAELLWPDLDPESGSANLRVTLAHLRRLLEPGRGPGEAGYHLRSDATTIRLVDSPWLEVDLWEVRRHGGGGDVIAVRTSAELAARAWRGPVLPELERFDELAGELQHARSAHRSAMLELSQVLLAQGVAAGCATLAGRVLQEDPYCERAHRLVIAAHLQDSDRRGAVTAARRLVRALRDLGVPAERSTEVLLRQPALRASLS